MQGGTLNAVSLASAANIGAGATLSGTANLSGGDVYVTGTNPGYVVSSHTDVLSANGGFIGTFSALNTASNVMLSATLNYDANNAWLNVQQVQVTAIQGATYTAASLGAAQRVQGAFDQINAQLGQSVVPGGVTLASANRTPSGPVPAGFVSGAAKLQQAESVDQGNSHAAEGMLYAGLFKGPWYVMGRFGAGDYRENMRRQVPLGALTTGVGSDSHGRYGVLYGESGYRFALGDGWQLTPYFNLQYASIRDDGFQK